MRTLGGLHLLSAAGADLGLPPGKPLALLLLVALSPGGIGRDQAARMLWPGDRSARGRQSLRQALHTLRRVLGEDAFASEEPLTLRPGLLAVDVVEVDDALRQDRLEEAVSLWQGVFLSGFEPWGLPDWSEWVERYRARAERALGAALRARAQTDRIALALDRAQGWLEEAVRVDPLSREGWVALVEVLLDRRATGRAASVLLQARQVLDGTDAEEELRALEAQLRQAEAQQERAGEGPSFQLDFVGRTRELAALLELWREVRGGTSRVAVLSGPAGIGKTRLAEEAARAAAGRGGTVVHVKASQAERTLDGAVLATLVERLLDQRGAAGISVASDRLLRSLLPSRDPGGTAEPAQFSTAVADALTDLVEAVAYERPLFLHLDDLHWADPASRTVILAALARLRESPVLAVVALRLDEADDATRLAIRSFAGARHAWEGRLEPLSQPETLELLTRTLDGSAQSPVLQRIAHVVGGSPLFAVELLRSFREQGLLEVRAGRWWLHADRLPSEVRLPASVRDVIEQRLSNLSADAQVLAGVLARQPREAPLGRLGRWSGLRTGALARAAHELVLREVVRWQGSEAIDFAHDELRTIARERFGGLGPQPGRWPIAAVITAVLLLSALGTSYWTMRSGSTLYGGGVLYLNLGDSLVALAPGTEKHPEWRRTSATPPLSPGPTTYGPFPTTGGEPVWIRDVNGLSIAPYVVRLFPDSEHVIVRRDRADANIGSVSPDGSEVAYQTENVKTPRYDDDLVVARIDGTQPVVLYRARERVSRAQWAPDGHAIAAVIYGRPDTLALFSPRGGRLGSVPLTEANGLSWCGESRWLTFTYRDGPDRQLARLDTRTLRTERIPSPPTLENTACSPDGSAVAFQGILDGRLALVVLDLASGRLTRLAVAGVIFSLRWNPDRLRPVPAAVRILDPPRSLAWGERATLRTATTFTDGNIRPAPLEWRTSDRTVIAIDEGGHAIANRPGRAWLTVTAAGWRADSVLVTVPEGTPAGTLLQDAFDAPALDTSRWQVIGLPSPEPLRFQGEVVLSLRGDGQYVDGLMSRRPVALPRGGTLEAEFLLRVTRPDRQRFALCLTEAEPRAGANAGNFDSWMERQQVCFGYPGGELLRFDPAAASVSASGVPRVVRLPAEFPPHGWTHVALELQPDGECAAYVNHRLVARAPIRLRNDPGTKWRVLVTDAAVDTDVFVRDLLLRSGALHPGTAAR